MIVYLDTSVFVPLLITELGSGRRRRFWDDADVAVSSRLSYVETASALAQAQRMGRIDEEGHDVALGLHDRLWSQIDVAEFDERVMEEAAALAQRFALRGYDAVH